MHEVYPPPWQDVPTANEGLFEVICVRKLSVHREDCGLRVVEMLRAFAFYCIGDE